MDEPAEQGVFSIGEPSGCAAVEVHGEEATEVPCGQDSLREDTPVQDTARLIARLDPPGEFVAGVVAYESTTKGHCWTMTIGDSGFDPNCIGDGCEVPCLTWGSDSELSGQGVMAAGVPARGDSLIVRWHNGDTERFRLDGPIVPGRPQQRIVMLLLRAEEPLPELVVLDGATEIATSRMP